MKAVEVEEYSQKESKRAALLRRRWKSTVMEKDGGQRGKKSMRLERMHRVPSGKYPLPCAAISLSQRGVNVESITPGYVPNGRVVSYRNGGLKCQETGFVYSSRFTFS